MSADRYRDAELALACCVLHQGRGEVIETVKPESVADPTARAIIEVAAELLATGSPVDCITVSLARANNRDWPSKVHSVYAHPGVVPANWRTYRSLVTEGAFLRRAVAAAERILHAADIGKPELVADALSAAGAVKP